MDFNSTLLKPMPKPEPKARKVVRNGFFVLLVVVLLAVVVSIIYNETLPADGVGYVLYWLHDHVYLVLKGYAFSSGYPLSLLFWLPLGSLIIIWLISVLRTRSLFRYLQVFMGRHMARQRTFQPMLTATAAFLKKLRFPPLLLSQVVNVERQKALNQLCAVPMTETPRHVVAPLVSLTILHARLTTLPPAAAASHLQAAAIWLETYIRLHNRLPSPLHSPLHSDPHPTANAEAQKHMEKPTQRLAAQAEALLKPLLNFTIPEALAAAHDREPGFHRLSILTDLLYIAALRCPAVSLPLLGMETPGEREHRKIARRLAESTAARRRLLDQNRIRLEDPGKRQVGLLLNEEREHLPLLGKLAMLIAMEATLMTRQADIGIGFAESIEALDFVLYQYLPERDFDTLETLTPLQKLTLLIDGLPNEKDYRLCAEILEKETLKQKSIWEKINQGGQRLLTTDDFDFTLTRAHALYHAAGPGFQPQDDVPIKRKQK